MKTRALFSASLSSGLINRLAFAVLANEASQYDQDHDGDGTTLDNDVPESAVLINEVTIDDRGWAVIPFGDFPHEMGMQKFHREQAQAIANTFNNVSGRFRRAVCGLPIFKGHPDHPSAAIANQYPDKEEKGQIAAVEVRPNGLALKLILGNAGADLVRKGWKYISPLWIAQLISKAGEAFRTYAPTELRSIGLVIKPNIPSPSLANAGQPANQNKKMKVIITTLGLAETATEDQVLSAIKLLQTNAGALANEQSALVTVRGELTAATGKITLLEGKVTQAATDLTGAQTALANERTARIGDHVALAIRTGRMTQAEKATWEARLKANFETEAPVLANAAPKVKTASEIPDMLKTLEAQMRADLENAGKKDAKKKDGADDADEDDTKDECGLGNSDYAAMTPKARGDKMKECIGNHSAKLANSPEHVRYNQAFGNAKKANPALFGFQQADVAK